MVIVHPSRTMKLKASSDQSTRSWISRLQRIVQLQKGEESPTLIALLRQCWRVQSVARMHHRSSNSGGQRRRRENCVKSEIQARAQLQGRCAECCSSVSSAPPAGL
jgi:hypothetical protein